MSLLSVCHSKADCSGVSQNLCSSLAPGVDSRDAGAKVHHPTGWAWLKRPETASQSSGGQSELNQSEPKMA